MGSGAPQAPVIMNSYIKRSCEAELSRTPPAKCCPNWERRAVPPSKTGRNPSLLEVPGFPVRLLELLKHYSWNKLSDQNLGSKRQGAGTQLMEIFTGWLFGFGSPEHLTVR